MELSAKIEAYKEDYLEVLDVVWKGRYNESEIYQKALACLHLLDECLALAAKVERAEAGVLQPTSVGWIVTPGEVQGFPLIHERVRVMRGE